MLLQVTGWIDQGLNERAYIIPGLGDFGERRYVHPHVLYNVLSDDSIGIASKSFST